MAFFHDGVRNNAHSCVCSQSAKLCVVAFLQTLELDAVLKMNNAFKKKIQSKTKS